MDDHLVQNNIIHKTLFLILLILFTLLGCNTKILGPVIVREGVEFRLKAPNARTISITGNFNNWNIESNHLRGPDSNGIWKITIPLKKGRYQYMFVIDGKKWVIDPYATSYINDGFGGKNALFIYK